MGATKSCSFDAKLALSIDGSKDVETEPVSINIWNPRNSNWDQHFLDGDKIRQKMIDLKHSKGNTPSSTEDEWLIKEWRWLEDKLTDYPFIKPTD